MRSLFLPMITWERKAKLYTMEVNLVNDGQKKFYEYIMSRVKLECTEQTKDLLLQSFARQDDGTFDEEVLQNFHDEIERYIKPENLSEIVQVLSQFGSGELS